VLVAHLPPESETGRAYNGEAAEWSRTDHLLASVFDAMRVLIWQNENMGRKSPTQRPRPLPRPGLDETPASRMGTPVPLEELKVMLAASAPPGSPRRAELENVEGASTDGG
jgi:hypothetical protein